MIISILGISGAKCEYAKGCKVAVEKGEKVLFDKPFYEADLLGKRSDFYINSSHFLLENFDKKFVFLGTECAITFQKDLLKEYIKDKDIEFIQVAENDLDDIFEKIYQLLDKKNKVMLDITHGFRDQSIMAIFSSTLSQFIEHKELNIFFAREIERLKKYRYEYLDDYIEISMISLLLSGFIKTLNFMPTKKLKLLDNRVFESFSRSLLSNDLVGAVKYQKKLFGELDVLLSKNELKHLHALFEDVKEELKIFEDIDKKEYFEQYFLISNLTLKKNYLVICIAYLFESLREYCSLRFEKYLKSSGIVYEKRYNFKRNTEVMDVITNLYRNGRPNKIQKKDKKLYDRNKTNFQRILSVYEDIRKLRNDLAHINQTKSFEDIYQDISKIMFKTEFLYKEDILKKIY